ncbi:putative ribonuclease H-like domain-containing protein, partial [Tanacetum coccineum]
MDVKSAFVFGKIEEEVYVCQPIGFEDTDFPDRVYKVEKAFYGLHQALELVQVYVDDIIFGTKKKSLCTEFEMMMHKKFQISSMGELTFFLGMQVKQKEDGIFISQDKYVTEILKKFGFTNVKTTSTPMETQKPLLKDDDVYACARYQVNQKVSHLHAEKRIFRHLKSQPKLGLWYLKDSPFDLVAYTDNDYAGASLDRKSTTGDSNEKKQIQMIKIHTDKNVIDLLTKAFDATVKVKTVNGEQQLQALVDGKKIIITEATVRRDLPLEDADGVDCLPNATIFEQRTLVGNEKLSQKLSFYKAFFSPQWKFLIHTQQEQGGGSAMPTDPYHTPIITQPSSSQPQKKQKSRRPKEKDTQ